LKAGYFGVGRADDIAGTVVLRLRRNLRLLVELFDIRLLVTCRLWDVLDERFLLGRRKDTKKIWARTHRRPPRLNRVHQPVEVIA